MVLRVNTNYFTERKRLGRDLNVLAPGVDLCVWESEKLNWKKKGKKVGGCFMMHMLV